MDTPCGCGCGADVPLGRKFVNQSHYDRSKGLSASAAEQVVVGLAQGMSAKQLAREYKVAHTTVYRLLGKESLRVGLDNSSL